ncbi:MAG TPA: tRNA epoxyqueuosine(34) reductase QueG, partial [Thermoanaerobaculia bacterium]|nr:tRNA epoxyqueuosine(34) reductase QueG [Thermoanaerobaculia bacterium]
PAFLPRDEYLATPVTDLLRLTQSDFSTLFRKSAIKRAKLAGMLRNVEALTSEADRGRVER